MEYKDHLKEILAKIGQVNESIDLEEIILNAIQKEEYSKAQIARYKRKGIKALVASVILIIVLAIQFSMPSSVRSVEYAIIIYTSLILVLFILFVQIEMGNPINLTDLNNNKL